VPAARVLKVNRFTVMAILQAARAERLGLPRDSAYSWGLNRAIFYAAAKRGFRSGGGGEPPGTPPGAPSAASPEHPDRELYTLGEDSAFRDTRSEKLYFTIGDETQTEKEFARQIASRFPAPGEFDRVWHEAEKIVEEQDVADLRSASRFYSVVYKPRRDALVEKWAAHAK
jgi:hypothetical protein